ncbi:MAG: protein translocase subunit SecE [Caloramator sp.]|jgi:preprotein translocase subunit SecE|uniref:Protein translocase subunit SecE n=1 Tax=Caloramator proteoclasticus DSM 10124 TaxID=1121262 RepID=A0A1M5B318_9CLOT|nr:MULTISPECIES: preprotein translocase subunit SecE [Caloramator]GIW48896.1 MAG: protein translocase subunit SecE [Caloramator sp.]SHF36848.1 preprotein translocase subunit SecE [Caloramator proteoclasticus DSM 10124]
MAAKSNGVVSYFKDIKAEFKKITWPTLNDVKESTIKTLVVMLFFTVVIAVYDSVFSNILKGVLNYFK